MYGYYVITKQYFDRYKMPVMHTETNRTGKHAVEWMWKEWMNLLRLREDGVPIIGFTWYGLVDMIDWDSALTNLRGHVNNVGLFTLERRERKVAREFRRLVEIYNTLPISSSKMMLTIGTASIAPATIFAFGEAKSTAPSSRKPTMTFTTSDSILPRFIFTHVL